MASRRSSCERKVHHHPSLLHPPPKKDRGQEDPRVKIEFMKGLGEGVWEVWASWEVQGCPGWQIWPGEMLLNIWLHVLFDQHLTQSRGFAFLTFESIDDATAARNSLTDTGFFLNTTQVTLFVLKYIFTVLDGRKIRVDYSITKRAHTPTPGMYMGR